MLREHIKFKNAYSLVLRPQLHNLIGNGHGPRYFEKQVSLWKDRGLKTLFLLTPPPSPANETLQGLSKTCEASGLRLEYLDPEAIQAAATGNDFVPIQAASRRLEDALRRGHVLLLCGEPRDGPGPPVETVLLLILLGMRAFRRLSVDRTVRYILNREPDADVDSAISRYKQFLDQGFEGSQNPPVEESSPTLLPAAGKTEGQARTATRPQEESVMNTAQDQSAEENMPAAGPGSTDAAPAGDGQEQAQTEFQGSRFTIKVKMLTIISAVMVSALGVMIFLASSYFRQTAEDQVNANNFNLANVIGSRMESELNSMRYKANLLALTVDQSIGSPEQRDLFVRLFFEDNPDFLMLLVADRAGDGMRVRRQLFNDTYLTASDELDRTKLLNVHGSNSQAFMKSFNGAFVVHNASVDVPIIAISQPLGASIIILYMDPAQFLQAFQTEGIVETFMVNEQGDVIAHQDSRRVLSRVNLIDLPIVKNLLESPVDEGQSRYVESASGDYYLGSYAKLGIGGLGIISTVPENKAYQVVDSIQTRNLLIAVIVTAVAFLIVYFFANSLAVPIVNLVGATRKIARAEFDIDLKPTTRDEVGELTHSFTHMAGGLAERERAKDALTKFVNKQIADLALSGKIKLGGETKEAAVFFSDLRGFTAMSENMAPEEVVAYLNEYFTGMVSAVNKTHGIVDKFIGDAVMAHWGAFGSQGNNTENAINGALLMRTAILEFNKRSAGQRPFAKQGCGINTGNVVSGQIGSEERFEFTVIGDTVNLASRIEALNKPFGTDILISQDSYDHVKGIFKVEPMPAIKVKGKAEPQTIYAVVGRNDDPNCPKDLDAVREMLGIDFDKSKMVDPDAKEEKFQVVGQ